MARHRARARLTYFAVREADKPADEEHPFGHAKIEAVAALAADRLSVRSRSRRRRRGAPPHRRAAESTPIVFAFGAIVISLVVDLFALAHAARDRARNRSDALAADALHYSSDLVSSVLVLAGLVATRFGLPAADALAAIGVAGFIAVSGYRLGRRTLNALLDAAPEGLAGDVRLRRGRAAASRASITCGCGATGAGSSANSGSRLAHFAARRRRRDPGGRGRRWRADGRA